MAFVLFPSTPCSSTRVPPICGRRTSNRRPPRRTRRSPRSSSRQRSDPILNDDDVDTTDITTYISCPVCFNSIMLRPQQLTKAPLTVVCNCCGQHTEATLERLENLDGTPFNAMAWRKGMFVAAGQPPPYSERDLGLQFETFPSNPDMQ
ncbi:hypothetical protein BWQ96_01134 [Gracilariopsis chorda]|uniref:Uncharacterized protein n=1 Tax=Gracilariopsis chorda TaxID=448386 RepID=A0A2V3J3G5_9FLOR|nr:hypothetical protein BWQ96_01134 [Gracilariopsis chorda]|eukprot:PXF48996.1 hypothetical protein BWQ96_01134 [Gracilariopsis chorda]